MTKRDESSSRRFGEREVARIIERATEIERGGVDTVRGGGLTLEELAEVAREAGIDPAVIRRAAADVELESRARSPASRLAGGPLSWHFERVLEGELPVDRYEDTVALLQRTTGDRGEASLRDGGITWRTGESGELSRRLVGVRVEDGQTIITWDEKLTNLAAALFGGLGAGVGGGLGAVAGAPLWAAGATVLGVGAPIVIAGGCFILARSVFGRSSRRREAAAREAIDRIALLVESTP